MSSPLAPFGGKLLSSIPIAKDGEPGSGGILGTRLEDGDWLPWGWLVGEAG